MAPQTLQGTGLPEKDWFSIQEVAARWGCPIEQLTHYAENGLLQVCFNFTQVPAEGISIFSNAAGKESTVKSLEWYIQKEGLFGIPPKAIAVMNREGSVNPSELYLPDQKYTDSAASFLYDKEILEEDGREYHFVRINDNFPMHRCEVSNSPGVGYSKGYVVPEKLLITRHERDRFERRHRVGAYAGTMPSDYELADSVESENLRLLLRASREFWSTAEPDNPATHPTNEEVCSWLEGKKLSKRLAEAGATFIRPPWAKSGRPVKGK